jgi:Asp-tRNA(Asn)/Glu-tRNA(Gln) amidotransferase A subunit family amidase
VVDADRALQAAHAADRARSRSRAGELGALHGVPITIKLVIRS